MSTFYGALPARFPKAASAPQASSTGFGMASGSRLFTDWPSVTITTDSILRSELVRMRNRSRQLARDEDYMRAFLISCRNNIIGPNGASLTMDVRDPNGESDDLANDAIEGAWDDFSKPWGFDASGKYVPHFCTNGTTGRVEFSHLGITTAARDGEFYYRLVRGFDNPWSFSVQPINPDYIDEEKNETLRDGSRIVMGVQKNGWGQVTHYWMRAWNPGDVYQTAGQRTSQPVPASEIRRFLVPDDFELSRGYPWIHAGATRLKMLGGYEEAALEAARSAACKHEYFTQTPDTNGEYQGDAQDSDGNFLSDVEPGQKEILPIGMNVQSIDPAYPHTDHRPFINATLMGVAAGLGLSYSALTGDLTQANYSSLRAGLLPERDMWRLMQSLWICQVEMPIFLEWLRMALLSRAIKLPNGSALPIARFDKFAKPVFQGRRWAWVDPQKDQNANAIALEQMLTTRTAVATEQGSDFEEILRGRSREKKLFEKYGLEEPLSDAEAKAAAAQPAPMPEKEDDNDDEPTQNPPQPVNLHVNLPAPPAPAPVAAAPAPQPMNINVEIKPEAGKPVKRTVLLTRDAKGAATGAQITEE
jgi:lambda family phage portal protein